MALVSFASETSTAKHVGVIDGDTIEVLRDGKAQRIRLDGIDCPEKGDDFSNKAKQFTSSLVFGKVVEVRGKEYDRYNRLVARVLVDGQDISVALAQAGLAWHYTKYSSDPVLARAENVARSAEIGVWSLPNPAPPWELRAQRAGTQSAAVSSQPATGTTYQGNRKSHVFHAPHCRYYGCKNCTAVFQSKEEAVKAGYRPCKQCNP